MYQTANKRSINNLERTVLHSDHSTDSLIKSRFPHRRSFDSYQSNQASLSQLYVVEDRASYSINTQLLTFPGHLLALATYFPGPAFSLLSIKCCWGYRLATGNYEYFVSFVLCII